MRLRFTPLAVLLALSACDGPSELADSEVHDDDPAAQLVDGGITEPSVLVKLRVPGQQQVVPVVLVAGPDGTFTTALQLKCGSDCGYALSAFGFSEQTLATVETYDSLALLNQARRVDARSEPIPLRIERGMTPPAVFAAFRVVDGGPGGPQYLLRLTDAPNVLFATRCETFLRVAAGSLRTTPVTKDLIAHWGRPTILPLSCQADTPMLPPPAPLETATSVRSVSRIVGMWSTSASHPDIRTERYPYLVVEDASGTRQGYPIDCGSAAPTAVRSFGFDPDDLPSASATDAEAVGLSKQPVIRCAGGLSGATSLAVTSPNETMPTTRFTFGGKPALFEFTCPETEAFWRARSTGTLRVPHQALGHVGDSSGEIGRTQVHRIGCGVSPGWVVDYLKRITGRRVLLGQENLPLSGATTESERVQAATGRGPALHTISLHAVSVDAQVRASLVQQAIRAWNGGALVRVSWEPCPPTGPATCTLDTDAPGLADAEWTQLVTDGSTLNYTWKSRLDELAAALAEVQARGIPVIFAPLPATDAPFYWWQGREAADGSQRLWRLTQDYLRTRHKLTRLAWAWSSGSILPALGPLTSSDRFYPGDASVDVLECAALTATIGIFCHLRLRDHAGKPLGLANLNEVPSSGVLELTPQWAYASVAPYFAGAPAISEPFRMQYGALYGGQRGVVAGQVPLPGSGGDRVTTVNLAAGKTITAKSSRSDRPPALAVDGFGSTRWVSNGAGEQWLLIDLGAEQTFRRVLLEWDDDAFATRYELKTTLDGKQWGVPFSTRSATGREQQITIPATKARWIGLYLWTGKAEDRYALRELTVQP